jgi:hypothetical protein
LHQPQLRIKKPKLLRSNPLRLSLIKHGTRPSDIEFEDEDILVQSRRENLAVIKTKKFIDPDPDAELRDDIKFRLFLARQLAMMKYKEKWG